MKKSEHDGYISISKEISNLDRYIIRTSIKRAIENCFIEFNGKLLDVGCGKMPYREFVKANCKIQSYVGVDIELGDSFAYHENIKPDFFLGW